MNISKEVKFVKAKEPVVVAPIVEKTKGEKKNMCYIMRFVVFCFEVLI